MTTKTITLSADRPALEIIKSGEVIRWEYDIVPCKLEAERLEELHGLRNGNELLPPTGEFIKAYQAFLTAEAGLPVESIDFTLRFYHLIRYQFAKLSSSLFDQLGE